MSVGDIEEGVVPGGIPGESDIDLDSYNGDRRKKVVRIERIQELTLYHSVSSAETITACLGQYSRKKHNLEFSLSFTNGRFDLHDVRNSASIPATYRAAGITEPKPTLVYHVYQGPAYLCDGCSNCDGPDLSGSPKVILMKPFPITGYFRPQVVQCFCHATNSGEPWMVTVTLSLGNIHRHGEPERLFIGLDETLVVRG